MLGLNPVLLKPTCDMLFPNPSSILSLFPISLRGDLLLGVGSWMTLLQHQACWLLWEIDKLSFTFSLVRGACQHLVGHVCAPAEAQ